MNMSKSFLITICVLVLIAIITLSSSFHVTASSSVAKNSDRIINDINDNNTSANLIINTLATSAPAVAGGFMGANNGFLSAFKPGINQLLKNEVKTYKIPNINQKVDDISFSVTSITVTSFTCNDCLSLAIVGDYIKVNLADAAAVLHLEYYAEWTKVIHLHASGHCSPKVSGVSATAHATFGPPSSSGTPTLKISNLAVSIGSLDADCSGISGFIVDGLVDLIKNFFIETVTKILQNVLQTQLNNELKKFQLKTSIDGGFSEIDFSIVPQKTFIENNQIQIGVKGIVYPIANPSIVFPFPPPAGFKNFCNDNQVQFGLSSYTLNTAFYSYYAYDRMHATFPNVLKASAVEFLLPGFAKNLGKDAELSATFVASNYGLFSTNATSKTFNFQGPFNLTISSARGNYYYTLGVTATATVGASISTTNSSQAAVMLNVKDIQLINPKVLDSNVGGGSPFVAIPVVLLLDAALSLAVSQPINKYLQRTGGIPLPTFMGFEAKDPSISYNDLGICIALNVQQKP